MTIKNDGGVADNHRGLVLVAAGGILGALASASCCILPLVLFSLGVGGAWIGNFTQLAPYQPWFVVGTLACLGTGYWLVYRSSKDRKSTRLNSSHLGISYAVFCLKKKKILTN